MKTIHWCMLVALVCGTAGCVSRAPRPFPIGLYGVPKEALEEVRAAGFSVVLAAADPAYVEAASSAGVDVILNSAALVSESAMADEIRRYDRHPAVCGWYIVDEPDLHLISPSRVDQATRRLNRRAIKPSVVTVASGSAAATYGKTADLLFMDFYPVPWAPVSRFSKELRLATLARCGKPCVAIIQAFDWAAFPGMIEGVKQFRAPTYGEVRCMVYMALAQQVRGIFFYAYEGGGWKINDSPLWDELRTVVREMNERLPLFTAERVWWPYEIEYGDKTAMYNEMHEGRIILLLLRVTSGTERCPAGYYFVGLNTTPERSSFRFKLPFETRAVSIFGDERTVQAPDGWVDHIYEPFEVVVYGPINEPLEY